MQKLLPLPESKGIKKGWDRENSRKCLSFGEKIKKIGPVDPEIIWLKLKKKELWKVKYRARFRFCLSFFMCTAVQVVAPNVQSENGEKKSPMNNIIKYV